METNNISKKFQSFTPEYHEEDWHELEAMLDQRDRRKALILPMVFSALAAIILSFGLYFHYTSSPNAMNDGQNLNASRSSSFGASHPPIYLGKRSSENNDQYNSTSLIVEQEPSQEAKFAQINTQLSKSEHNIEPSPINLISQDQFIPIKISKEKNRLYQNLIQHLPILDLFAVLERNEQIPNAFFAASSGLDRKSFSKLKLKTEAGVTHFHYYNTNFKSAKPGLSVGLHAETQRLSLRTGLTVLHKYSYNQTDEFGSMFTNNSAGDPGDQESIDQTNRSGEFPVYSERYSYLLGSQLMYRITNGKFSISAGPGFYYSLNENKFYPGMHLHASLPIKKRFKAYTNFGFQEEFWTNELGIAYQF